MTAYLQSDSPREATDLDAEIKRYGNAILKYCFGILCDYHEAQDAMQETFAKAHASRKNLKSYESYAAWLYKIAYNTCLNMRRKRRVLLVSHSQEHEGYYHMDEPFIDSTLQEALLILTPPDRALFYSRAVEDMDYSQLEALYNTRAATLRKRFERAKTKLRDYLVQNGYTWEGSERS
ncbi:MAG: sigma-70 family RNA polymerase sigma factor [Defluviitaleaceae bacterium]|nr:sigma-70 family RNA polymerase sigma factor [Defluviitaleaceae bacterium]